MEKITNPEKMEVEQLPILTMKASLKQLLSNLYKNQFFLSLLIEAFLLAI